jgi:hypothetical protein
MACIGLLPNGRSCPRIVPKGQGSYCQECKASGRAPASYTRNTGSKELKTYAWKQQRIRVLKRDKYTCQMRLLGCTVKANTVNHKNPRVRAGTHAVPDSMLEAACTHCNSSEGGRLAHKSRSEQ